MIIVEIGTKIIINRVLCIRPQNEFVEYLKNKIVFNFCRGNNTKEKSS